MKTILLTGATGFIGKRLSKRLLEKGYAIRVLSRHVESAKRALGASVLVYAWQAEAEVAPVAAFENVDAVVHLAGESVAAGRWTEQRKKEILESRTIGTANLLRTLSGLSRKPECLISSSAIGIYGDRGDEELSENSTLGSGFLAEVCKAWESEGEKATGSGIRFVAMRTGLVLGVGGGALSKMLPAFKMGLGGPLGNGAQWMSWIHVDDLVEAFIFAIENPKLSGAVNASSSNPVQNREFTRVLGRALHRPAFLAVPFLALKLLFGEMSQMIVSSQRVLPAKLLVNGFSFRFPKLEAAFAEIFQLSPKQGAPL